MYVYSSFTAFMQTLETNKLDRLELSEKSLTLLKHGDIIIKSMSQAREKWDSLVWDCLL